MTAQALWFGPRERPLFGWVHRPPGGGARPAVVICPPLGRELINAHYPLQTLAQELAAAGMLAIRFDYDGTGDSAGGPDDPDRIESWLRSIEHAVALARAEGATSVALVGLRMGSLLTELVTPRLPDLTAVVLWDPCVSGRAFVRHQRAIELLRVDADNDTRPPYAGAPGGLINAETLDALKRLKVTERDVEPQPSTLVLHRPEESALETLLGRLVGRQLDVEPVAGQPEMLDVDSGRKLVPDATLARIVSWLAERLIGSTPGAVAAPSWDPDSWIPSAERAEAVIERVGPGALPVRERIMKLGRSGLFAIETTRDDAAPALPTIVFLNGGTDWRAGPNRMWVRLARRWAELGFRSVRLDFSGLGDSPARPGCRPQAAGTPETFDDLDEALPAISPQDPSNIIFVGLCSSGYTALEYGLVLKPRGILGINSQLAFTPPEMRDGGAIDRRRRICVVTNSDRVQLYRRLVSPTVRQFLRPLAWRLRRLLAGRRHHATWIDELLTGGTDFVNVCGEDDLHQLPPEGQQSIPATPDRGLLRIEVIDGLHHVLVHPDDQRDVTAIFTDYLTTRYGLASPSAPSHSSGEIPHDAERTVVANAR